jgi:hypothetical protein
LSSPWRCTERSTLPAAAEAEERFKMLTGAGYIAAKRTGSGTAELIRKFDATAEETLFIPRLQGG